jgi:hypothetical protein
VIKEKVIHLQVIDLLNPGTARKPLAVRWSKKSRGFFVENLFTVDCEELDDLLAVLEEGNFIMFFILIRTVLPP